MPLSEFDLIHHYFTREPNAPDVVLGIGDDAAILQVPAGEHLLVSTDTLVAGRHFPLNTAPEDIGWKALAVNLSDLAAMGATPRWCLLALTLPDADPAFLQGFAKGFWTLADEAGISLVGGDTTRGPLTITVTVMGTVPAGQALRRDGARPGDDIYVSGTVGDAGLGLQLAIGQTLPGVPAAAQQSAMKALNRPRPRLALGLALRGLASSAIDISDGLAQDLGHILERSGVGATLDADRLPLSESLLACDHQQALHWALSAGDDYELCFTAAPDQAGALADLARQQHARLTRIGHIEAAAGLRITRQGNALSLDLAGFQHFQGQA
jgi:thiamine-monophosphate kinase